MTNPILFRPQRGGLAEAMAEVRTIADRADLVAHLAATLGRCGVEVTDSMVKVEPYHGFDERIGWDTYIVTVDGWGPAGFTNGPL
ncbi:hypothetical protein DK419_13040 [Methylobacterium terrae]|uniref:Uncharacterized protein n=1 Tax=Methylobacterium terrae TaxID=2202827 RepID=A0A2U8WPJ1_9HYPH|nr:hypothetical protein [Methylobacterium terrae]AWN47122.1 hypothetical protein DK419_13040 [Methylobacterium terrae]